MNSDPGVDGQAAATLADPAARSFLRKSDPVLARLIDGQPDFHPRKGATLRALAERFVDASEFEKGT